MSTHTFDLATIGSGLPVASARAEIERAAAAGAMVVTAPPGTGKTTLVPPLIANMMADRGPGSVLLTQPRRVAVRAAANRIAALDGSRLGGPVGFTVRGERRVSTETRIEAVTPGVLLRRLIADPALEGVAAVILDEVHERSVDSDLLLGMLAEVRELRDDLLLVAMSATLDAARIAELLGTHEPAPVVDVPSPLHELHIDYAPYADLRLDDRGVTRGYLAHLTEAALRAQREDGCDALVFVPGAREVDEVVRQLRARVSEAELEVLPLHGRLSAREQDRAVSGRSAPDPPRIVVSTSLAESSLTVPGVRLVIDSGLSREVRRDRGRDMAGLVTVSASRASAVQRSGRAARQGPGRAVRVYAEADFARMPAASQPEIASADLMDAALLLAAWGTPGGEGLALPTPPPAESMRAATRVLRTLQLVDGDGRTTPLGNQVARLPVGVREARALLAGAAEGNGPTELAEVIAAISDDHREPGADLDRLLRELRTGRAQGADRWRRETRRLASLVTPAQGGGSATESHSATQHASLSPGAVVALARPEWIARRTNEHSRSYLLASGPRAALPEGSGLIGCEWLAVHETQRAEGRAADGTGAVIRLAAALSAEEAERFGASLTNTERSARIDHGRVRVREERRLGAIVLASVAVRATSEDTGSAFTTHLAETGLAALDWNEAATTLRGRLALVHHELGTPWPAVDEASLLARLDDWLGPDLSRLRANAALTSIDVAAALRRLLPWPEAVRFDELVPERLAVPSGATAGIDYSAIDTGGGAGGTGSTAEQGGAANSGGGSGLPVVAVKLQELFGLADTPRLIDGRVPVLFHLLSPARRPLAVTADLSSFWNGPYQDVRKEMRGRYPKHPWPEDPWTAEATARTKRRA